MDSSHGPGHSWEADRWRQLAEGYFEGERVHQHMESEYIVWSHVLAFVGAYVAFSTTMYMKQVDDSHWYWVMLVQAGLSLGGCTIWSMHFVGMRALHLQGGTESGSRDEILIAFEPALTVSSAIVAWVMSTCALHVALPRKTNDMGHRHSRSQSIAKVRSMSRMPRPAFLANLVQLPLQRVVLSSVILGAAVCSMHYMGMISQCGKFTMSYNVGIVIASALVAVVVSFAGLAIFFFVFDSILYRTFSAVIISVAVNGMHYCGMASATYFAHPSGHRGPFGPGSVAWRLEAQRITIAVLLLDLTLMAATGYYVEVLETVRKREGEAFEKELRHKDHLRNVDDLIRRTRVMRYPMCVLRYETFAKLGKLVSHEVLRNNNKLIYLNTVAAALKQSKKHFIVFFSHQWLSRKIPDPKNRQFQDMLSGLKGLSAQYRVKLENMYIWVDYCSMPQEGMDQQQLAIDSLVTYASVCSAFVIIAPQVLHTETLTPCNFMTYSNRCWCRLEIFCSILASLRVTGESNQVPTATAVAVEEEEELALVPPGASDYGSRGMTPPQQMDQPAASQISDHHRVFFVVDDQVHRLNFFTKDGKPRREYEEMFFVFEGALACCVCGHTSADGRDVTCDKAKMVELLSGCYGSMLCDLRKSQKKGSPNADDMTRKTLAEYIVKLRQRIFPEEHFNSRIDAMHERVEGRSTRHIEEGDDDDASSVDEVILDLPDELGASEELSSLDGEELQCGSVEGDFEQGLEDTRQALARVDDNGHERM